MPDGYLPEKAHSFAWFTAHWNTVGRAEGRWTCGTKFWTRVKICKHLFDEVEAHTANFGPLRIQIKRQDKNGFAHTLARLPLNSMEPLMQVAAPYLALYHSSVSGMFDINNFALVYKMAIRC